MSYIGLWFTFGADQMEPGSSSSRGQQEGKFGKRASSAGEAIKIFNIFLNNIMAYFGKKCHNYYDMFPVIFRNIWVLDINPRLETIISSEFRPVQNQKKYKNFLYIILITNNRILH